MKPSPFRLMAEPSPWNSDNRRSFVFRRLSVRSFFTVLAYEFCFWAVSEFQEQ